MSVRDSIVLASFIVTASCAAGCTVAPKPLVVSCTMQGDQIDVISLDMNLGHATLLSVAPSLAGTARASPTEFEALFQPGPDGATRLLIKINRYSFRATRELGSQGAEGTAGLRSSGTCERYRGRPL